MKHLAPVTDSRAGSATPMEMASISAFNDRPRAAGHRVFAGSPESPSAATVTGNRGGEAVFIDGPSLASKEYFGGVSTIEALDIDVAPKRAAGGSERCNRKVAVRPFLGECASP
jgi:hypothetical protein